MLDPNPKTQYGDLKIALQLVPLSANIAIARALTEGAEKYGEYNWRNAPIPLMTYIGAIYRHLGAFIEGEINDPDSGSKEHLDGAIGSLAIMIDAMSLGPDHYIDDRPAHSSPGALQALREKSKKSSI